LAFAGHHRAERANNIDKGLFARFVLACRRRWQRLDTAWYDNLLTALINLAAVPSFAFAITAGSPLTIALASATLGVSLLHSLLLGFATLETYRLRRATRRADTFSDYISLPFELSWSPTTSFHEFDQLTQHPIQTHFSRFDQDEPYPEVPSNANLAPPLCLLRNTRCAHYLQSTTDCSTYLSHQHSLSSLRASNEHPLPHPTL
jgi:hypothetical protein